MTSASQPASRRVITASRSSSSSSGVTTLPCASMRSVTSRRSSRGISASKLPVRPQRFGRVRRPSSRASRNPRVATSPHFAPLRSRIALVATVVPCTTVSMDATGAPLASMPAMKPSACAPGVLATLAISNRPAAPSKEKTSVKVPPTSTPTRYTDFDSDMDVRIHASFSRTGRPGLLEHIHAAAGIRHRMHGPCADASTICAGPTPGAGSQPAAEGRFRPQAQRRRRSVAESASGYITRDNMPGSPTAPG